MDLVFFHYEPQILTIQKKIAIFQELASNWQILHSFTSKTSKYKQIVLQVFISFLMRNLNLQSDFKKSYFEILTFYSVS